MEILFVCSGNIVRSPLAEGYLRKVFAEIGVEDVSVSSAGTLGIEGSPADAGAVALALERGFDIRRHRSRGIDPRELSRADLIVVRGLLALEQGSTERAADLFRQAIAVAQAATPAGKAEFSGRTLAEACLEMLSP